MEFKDLIKKYFYTNSSSAASATARIPLLHSGGDPIGCDTLENIELASPTRTCGVLFATTDGSNIEFCNPYNVHKTVDDYHNIFGVAICEGGKCVIVGKDEYANVQWAAHNASGGSGNKGVENAIADMNGAQNTATIYNTLGSNAPAAEYCLKYFSKDVQSTSPSVGVGKWHLPSAGELWMIWSHLFEVERLMGVINGTQFGRTKVYWSSTEYSTTHTFAINFNNSVYSTFNKSANVFYARPVLSL